MRARTLPSPATWRPGWRLEALPHQGQRQLARQQLVVGEALPGRRGRRYVGRLLGPVQAQERRLGIGPAALGEPGRVLPLGQIGHPLQGLAGGLQQHLAGQPGGERIDRLEQGQIGARLRRDDVVGVRHLLLVVVALDAAADGADAPRGQLALDEPALGVEEHEVDAAAVVLAGHLVGRPGVAARRRLVLEHAHLQRGDGAGHGLGDGGRGAAVDDAGGRVPEQIDHARLADARRQPQRLLQQDLHARADAGKALRRGKEGCELLGPHGS